MTTNRLVRPGSVFRVGGVGAAVLALAASTTVENGDRGGSGWCPEGEQCADDTPEGLMFEGAEAGGWWLQVGVLPTAVGGIQRIRLLDKVDGLPLEVPFRVSITETDSMAAAAGNGPDVLVSASDAGSGYLRIARVADDYLFDRLRVESASVVRAEISPTEDAAFPTWSTSLEWAVLAGGTTDVAVSLFSQTEGGTLLIDESMALTTPTDSLRFAWDSLRITAPVGSAGYEVAVETGSGFTATLPVAVVDRITEVTAGEGSANLAVGDTVEPCFRAKSGLLEVFGVPWVFEVNGAAQPAPAAEQIHERCLKIVITRTGTATVTARALGFSASVSYSAGAGARIVEPQLSVPVGQPGERAATTFED